MKERKIEREGERDLVGVNLVVMFHGKFPGQRDRHTVRHYSDDERVNDEGGSEVGGERIGDSWYPADRI